MRTIDIFNLITTDLMILEQETIQAKQPIVGTDIQSPQMHFRA